VFCIEKIEGKGEIAVVIYRYLLLRLVFQLFLFLSFFLFDFFNSGVDGALA